MNICLLGATGTIGQQTLEVVNDLDNIKVVSISGHKNIELLEKYAVEYNPEFIVVTDYDSYKLFNKSKLKDYQKLIYGIEGLLEIVAKPNVDMVVNAIVGNIGLKPTVAAIDNNKDIAIANKETLVTAGEIIIKKVKDKGLKILPIDSEHSAILQCLQGYKHSEINKIILTASGGPFLNHTYEDLKNVKVEDALKHPNWSMGQKITIDSATMMNKGLEVIEAMHLFNVDIADIEIVIHPESIIHSMVDFKDRAVIAQLGLPDMKVPIQFALTYPAKVENNFPRLDLTEISKLNFIKPDINKTPCLQLAYDSAKEGGLMPTVMNAANEIAVQLFLNKEISFLDIPRNIEKTMNEFKSNNIKLSLENIDYYDNWAREKVLEYNK